MNVGNLNVQIGANATAFSSEIGKVQQTLLNLRNTTATGGGLAGTMRGGGALLGAMGGGPGGMLAGLAGITPATAGAAAAIGALSATAAGASWATSLAAQSEQAKVSFEVLMGSATEARALLGELRTFANTTPFEFPEVQDAGKQLLAFGVNGKEVTGTLRMLGDVASGVGIPLTEMADIFGRNLVQGKLMTKDLRELTGRGIPILQELAKQYGVNEAAIFEMAEAGKLTADDMISAFESMTGSGGRFGGMLERQSQTLTGMWSTFKDELADLARTVGEWMLPALKQGLQVATDLVRMLKGGAAAGPAVDLPSISKRGLGEQMEKQKAAEDAAKAAEKLRDEETKAFEKLRDRAASIASSLRTPTEQFRDTWVEIHELMAAGVLDGATFGRAIDKAKQDFLAATKPADSPAARLDQSVGAALRGTSAGFSAARQATSTWEQMLATQRQQLAETKNQNAQLKALVDKMPNILVTKKAL